MMPICGTILVVIAFSAILQNTFSPSFLRFGFSSIAVELLLGIMSWFFVLNQDERNVIVENIEKRVVAKWHRK
jgi:hypothetical protein